MGIFNMWAETNLKNNPGSANKSHKANEKNAPIFRTKQFAIQNLKASKLNKTNKRDYL